MNEQAAGEHDTQSRERIHRNIALLGLLMLFGAWYLRLPLSGSLWLDETVSVWVARGAPGEVVSKALTYQGQSPLYFLIVWLLESAGAGPVELRLVSLVAVLLAAGCIFEIARTVFSRDAAGWLSALLFLSIDPIQIAAVSIRPYAFAVLFALLSVLFLLRWLVSHGGRKNFAGAVLCAGICFYFHYLFAAILVLHAVALVLWRKKLEGRLATLVLGAPTLAVLAAPGLVQMAALASRREELDFVVQPALADLVLGVLPLTTTVSLGTAIALTCVFFVPKLRWSWTGERHTFLLLAGWWLLVPLGAFLCAYAGFSSFFLTRYFLWCFAGAVVLIAGVVLGFRPGRAATVCLAALVLMTTFRELGRQWEAEQWDTAVALIHDGNSSGTAPVLIYSGLIEAENTAWLEDPAHEQYFSAPLVIAGLRNPSVPLPSSFSEPRTAAYWKNRIKPLLAEAGHVYLVSAVKERVADDGRVERVPDTLLAYIESEGFEAESLFASPTIQLWEIGAGAPGT